MGDFLDTLKCDKIIYSADEERERKCLQSPARKVPIFNLNLCKEHQKELSEHIDDLLGETHDRGFE